MIVLFVALLLAVPTFAVYGVARWTLPAASAGRAVPIAVGTALPLVMLALATSIGIDWRLGFDGPHGDEAALLVAIAVAATWLFAVLARTPVSLARKFATVLAVACAWVGVAFVLAISALLMFGGIC